MTHTWERLSDDTGEWLQLDQQFNTFTEALRFINEVAEIAETLNHHPTIVNTYASVSLKVTTHDQGNKVTDRDLEFSNRVSSILD